MKTLAPSLQSRGSAAMTRFWPAPMPAIWGCRPMPLPPARNARAARWRNSRRARWGRGDPRLPRCEIQPDGVGMIANKLKGLWADGKPSINGWCSIGNPFTAEIMAAQGFDSIPIDMQHGALDYSNLLPMFQAMRASGATLMARVPMVMLSN